jgi:hypothetical protein
MERKIHSIIDRLLTVLFDEPQTNENPTTVDVVNYLKYLFSIIDSGMERMTPQDLERDVDLRRRLDFVLKEIVKIIRKLIFKKDQGRQLLDSMLENIPGVRRCYGSSERSELQDAIFTDVFRVIVTCVEDVPQRTIIYLSLQRDISFTSFFASYIGPTIIDYIEAGNMRGLLTNELVFMAVGSFGEVSYNFDLENALIRALTFARLHDGSSIERKYVRTMVRNMFGIDLTMEEEKIVLFMNFFISMENYVNIRALRRKYGINTDLDWYRHLVSTTYCESKLVLSSLLDNVP